MREILAGLSSRSARAIVALMALALSSACSTDLSSAVMPGVQLANHHRAFVVCRPQDDAGICAMIGRELQSHGVSAVTGTDEGHRGEAEVLVTYEDRWTWDITLYLLTLRIDLRDPQTNLLLATGHVYGTSLARSTPETMVHRVLDAIFTGKR